METMAIKNHSSNRLKALLAVGVAGAIILTGVPAVSAATASVGSVCPKLGATAKAGKTAVVCKDGGAQNVWTDKKVYQVSIQENAVVGGKNSAQAQWIAQYVIPNFTLDEASKGKQVKVNFISSGADDAAYKSSLALDLGAKKGPDVVNIDGFWVSEFADAGYIKPLNDILGAKAVAAWSGWKQIPATINQVMTYNSKLYGVPAGTDGRIIYFNKALFAQAGLPTNWQPKSWADILTAAETLKTKLPDVTPFQLNAGTAMGEATAMQGFLNFLAGAGSLVYNSKTGKWLGNTKAVRDMLSFYNDVYNVKKVGNADWQAMAGGTGRDASFKAFADGKLAMMIEGDYEWRSVINPLTGNFPMAKRDSDVGFAKIPAQTAGSAVGKQNFVSYSGGSGYIVNANSKEKTTAWELLQFLNDKGPLTASMAIGGSIRISNRTDVNNVVLATDPCLKYVFTQAIPNTFFRPANSHYNAVSVLLQQATTDVVNGGMTAAAAAAKYETALAAEVGAGNISSN